MTTYYKNAAFTADRTVDVLDADDVLKVTARLPTDENPDAVSELNISFSDIKKCDINGEDSSDFVVMACGIDANDNPLKISMLPFSAASKAKTPRGFSLTMPFVYIGFGVNASSFADAVVMCNASTLNVNGAEVSDSVSGFDGLTAKMGGLVLSLDGSSVSAQLVDSSGANLAQSGVSVYLETTVGTLSQTRLTTDANGSAATNISVEDGATGKIKAGFKHFSGIDEVVI